MEILQWPFRGTDALSAGVVTPQQLRTAFEMVHRNVYIPREQKLTPVTRAVAAWLWSDRTATVAKLSAAALLRTAWMARIDMGWEEWKVGVEFDGAQHWTDPARRTWDIDRLAELESRDWTIIRVRADLIRNRTGVVVGRARSALVAAGYPLP
jgi:hypothetical protein